DTFIVGDWTGDGKAMIGVVRQTASGVPLIVLDINGNGVYDAGDRVLSFGLNGDTFIVGDWTGDGKAKIGVVRPGVNGTAPVVLDTNGNGIFDSNDRVLTFGRNGDKFRAGRWKPAAALVAADGRRDAIVAPLTADANFTAAVNQTIDLWAGAGLDPASV